jgi:hypothetical protein
VQYAHSPKHVDLSDYFVSVVFDNIICCRQYEHLATLTLAVTAGST